MIKRLLSKLKSKLAVDNPEIKKDFIEAIQNLRNFFSIHNVPILASKCDRLLYKVSKNKLILKSDIRNFAGSGMGSLSDLYICLENGHSLNGMTTSQVNQELDFLIQKLYFAIK